jgi:gluconolactonase
MKSPLTSYPRSVIAVASLFFIVLSIAVAQSPIPPGAQLEKVATGFTQPEGPVWKDGVGLLFSDIAKSKIYVWTPADSARIYLQPSDSSNGLTLDLQGRLVLTQMLDRRVARQETDGTITPLASTYNGKRFNSPNDVVVKSDGSIFFTDPDFNVPFGQKKELTFQGIYRISPTGTLTLLDSTLTLPNGICFSPDEKYLYVNDSQKRIIYVWDVVDDSTISGKRALYTISTLGYADGMKVDTAGNIYCAGPTGIWIVSPSGTLLGKIAMTDNPSNCNWGDADRQTLYITAGKSLYRIRLSTTGVETPNVPKSGSYRLDECFPNPCNPSTSIQFHIPISGYVSLCIYDIAGREVTKLAAGIFRPGDYTERWDTSSVSSGIYFCRLAAASFSSTRKIVVLK